MNNGKKDPLCQPRASESKFVCNPADLKLAGYLGDDGKVYDDREEMLAKNPGMDDPDREPRFIRKDGIMYKNPDWKGAPF